MVYGATQGTQFRLRGFGSKKSLAEELLLKLPVSKPTHIVKAGLRGRLLYALKTLVSPFKLLQWNKLRRDSATEIAPETQSI